MEGQYRLEVVTAANSREKSQKENGKRKSQRYHKKYRNVGRTAEVDKKQSALESPDVNDKGNCPPELPSQEGAVEKHDKTAAISKSIIILRNTTGRFSKKRKQKTDSAKHSGKLSGSPSQQARPNDDEPESHTIGLILGRNEPSTLCKTTARLGVMNTPKVVGTRQRGSYPVMQHTATEKAGLKCLESTDTTCHKLQDTNLGNANSPKAKHKRSYRRLHEKQRAQHRMASDASAKVIDVPCSPSKSVKSFRRQKCESVQIADVAYVPGVKKVHWVDEVGVESVERESISCLANQGSASLQDHGLEHQIKAKSLHLKTSHLSFLEHQNLQHFSSTEVSTPIIVRSFPSFELSRQPSTHRRASLSDLQALTAPSLESSQTSLPRRQRSVTMPPCLDVSAGMPVSTIDRINGNNACLAIAAAIEMVREKYGVRKPIALSASTDKGSDSHKISSATNSPSSKPFFSSENTSHSAYETSNLPTTKPSFESSVPSTSTAITAAHIAVGVTESRIPAKTSADHDTKDVMTDIPKSKAVMTTPLAENLNVCNKPIKSRAREEKPAYIPPHLRVLMTAQATGSKQQDHEDSYIQTTKASEDTTNHDVHTGGITKRTIQGESTADIPQMVSYSKQSTSGGSGALKTLEKTQDPHTRGRAIEHVTAGDSPVKNVAPRLPKERSQEEIFVARAPKPKAPKKLIRIEDLLPEHLRNLPKPILMGPQVKRNAELAAKQVPLDPEVAIAQIVKRNEDYYQPVLEMEVTGKLVQELAAGEETPDDNAELAEDRSSMCSEDSKNITADVIAARRAGRWRWFNGKVEPSETGHHEQTPKKELLHELAAWDGQWLTPPIEWNLRGQFNNNTRTHVQWMEGWVLDRVMEALNKPVKLDVSNAGWLTGHTLASGTSKQWQTFPEDCIADHVPLEYGPVDWSRTPTLPPSDPYSQTTERQIQTSYSLSRDFCREHYAEKFSAMKEKLARRVEHAQMKIQAEKSRRERAPKANIYIRPAQLSDVPQIKHLYNHYISNTVHALELEATDDSEWQNRLQGAEDEKLAFLVAVLKAAKKYAPGAREGRRVENGRRGRFPRRNGFARAENIQRDFASETIVGFAYAEDHAGKHTMFQNTVELQLFVDPNHYKNGIGNTLMDRMMTSLDKSYMMEAATDFIDDGKMCYEIGGARDVHKILVSVGFHFGDEKELEWRKSWLEQKWEFDHIGTMNCLGKKFGKGVNIAQFLKETNMIHGCSIWYKEEPDRMPHREIAIRAREQEEARLAKEAALEWS